MDQDAKKMLLLATTAIVQEFAETSSSESEFEELLQLQNITTSKRNMPRINNYMEGVVTKLTQEEFKTHFRMSPETFDYVLFRIKPGLQRTTSGTPMICPRVQFLLTLWRLGTPDSFRSICERFNVGRSTALYITRRVVGELVKLAPVIIKWPVDEQIREVWSGFQTTSGFPKVIGAIDETHINIPALKDNEAYVNRKSHHSIPLQAVCDHRCRFTHCYIGPVGSIYDQHVFRRSEIQHYMGDVTKFPENSHLVGDLGYKLYPNLMIPYKDNGHLTEQQCNYNFCHSSARITIERAFRLLKGKFRSLLTTFAMNRVDLIPVYILACCVLHNICLMRNDELNLEINEAVMSDVMSNVENVHDAADVGAADIGAAKRDVICETLTIRHI